jgi:hypothetical protein
MHAVAVALLQWQDTKLPELFGPGHFVGLGLGLGLRLKFGLGLGLGLKKS